MRQVVLLDRDGTLIEDVGYISDYKKIIVKEGVFEGLLKLKKAGFTLVIVSNQSGIARNLISEEEFQLVNNAFIAIFTEHKIQFESIYYCFHLPSDNCSCRKPNTYFFETIKNYFENNLWAVMVGDSLVDAQFARNARIPFFSTGDISGYPQYGNFQDIANAILKESTNVE